MLRAGLSLLLVVGLCGMSCRRAPEPEQVPDATTKPAEQAQPAAVNRLTVFVSILPQAYFVERVGGRHVDVKVLVGPGQSPATYEPTPDQMSALAGARAFFRIGVPFEETLLPKIRGTFKDLEIVDTRAGITLRKMEAHEHEEHEGEHEHEHEAGGDDPHSWLNPKLVKIQAKTICDALCRLDAANAVQYQQNLAKFQADLDALDARIAESLAPLAGRELFVFHPAFGYFADAYGLKQVPVEIEGKEPAAKDVAALVRRAREANVRVIFVQPQFSPKSATAIAREIGGAVVSLDPLARDYMKSLEAMAQQIGNALAAGPPDPGE